MVYWQSDPVMEVDYRLKYGYSVNYTVIRRRLYYEGVLISP